MRYIDETLVNAKLKEICDSYAMLYGKEYGGMAEKFASLTDDIPTADVVEVVRCSECKHLEIINKAPIYAKCKKHGIVFELWQKDTRENFCSYGERRKENE